MCRVLANSSAFIGDRLATAHNMLFFEDRIGSIRARLIRAVPNIPQWRECDLPIALNYTPQPYLSIPFEYNTGSMTLSSLLAHWKADPQVGPNLIEWRILSGRRAIISPFPPGIHPALTQALIGRGINSLYTHQATTWKLLKDGDNVVVVTGTASGKTLCYNLPVLDSLLNEREATALYLFPTKALSQDQHAVLKSLLSQITNISSPNEPFSIGTTSIRYAIYDGDTL